MLRLSLLALAAVAATGSAQHPPSSPPAPTPAIVPASPALAARAAELLPILNGGGAAAATFAPEFLTAIPEPQVRGIAAQLSANLGKAVMIASVTAAGLPNQGIVQVRYEHGAVRLGLAVAPSPPARIVGLRVLGVQPDGAEEKTMSAVLDAMRALPGQVGFALADLGDGQPRIVESLAPDRALALGSAFKLVILAELVREIEVGRRRWDDMVTLDGTERPAGGYNQKPRGTQVSIRELARQMIAVSDNSATDVLLDTLGRETVEAMQATLGIAAPDRNRPFLSTMEAFKLKGVGGGALGARYLAATVADRRALLAGEVARTPGSAIGALFADGKPVRIDALEWFASPADVARVLDWIRHHTETGPATEGRAILAINSGLGSDIAARYRYVGFKGGSEPGVLNLSLLLQTKGGQWRVLTAGWNNPATGLSEARFVALVSRAAALAADASAR